MLAKWPSKRTSACQPENGKKLRKKKESGLLTGPALKRILSHVFSSKLPEANTKSLMSISGLILGKIPSVFFSILDLRTFPIQTKAIIPAYIYLFEVNNRIIRARCEICSKLTIKTPERNIFDCMFLSCHVRVSE